MKLIRYLTSTSLMIAGLVIYYIYRRPAKRKVMKVLWTNNGQQCISSTHNSVKCNKYCYHLKLNEINNLIKSAKYSIDIAMHLLTIEKFAVNLIDAYRRGVKVRYLYCYGSANSPSKLVLDIYHSGIIVTSQKKNFNINLMHHKFCIIDGEGRAKLILGNVPNNLKSTLITGSCNWTKQGFLGNYENIIITNNEHLLLLFEEQFELMWKTFRKEMLTKS